MTKRRQPQTYDENSKGTVIRVMVKKTNYSRMITVAVMAVMLVAATALAAKMIRVAKEAKGRQGPGSYYKLVAVIPANTRLEVLEEKDKWIKVKYKEDKLWVSRNTITETKADARGSAIGDLPMRQVSSDASPAVLTAAIKGFWTRYSRTVGERYELPVDGYDIPPSGYERFSSARSREVNRKKLMKKYRLRNKHKDHDIPSKRELSVGYACASNAATSPPIDNTAALEYLHYVGWYIADATERYDQRYTFYILDTDQINAIACPGGYIVLTRGLLKIIGDEAELAALLAHEMAHVVAGHGMLSAMDDKVRIKADSAFDALDKQVGSTETETDLIGITDRAMAIAQSPKQDEYEYEADEMALRYLARSGYDLDGLKRLLDKLKAHHDRNTDIFDLNYRNHPDFGKRLKRIDENIRDDYRKYDGETFASDFRGALVF